MRIDCPHCNLPLTISSSDKIMPGLVRKYCVCTNVKCDSAPTMKIIHEGDRRKPISQRSEDMDLFEHTADQVVMQGRELEAFQALLRKMSPEKRKLAMSMVPGN